MARIDRMSLAVSKIERNWLDAGSGKIEVVNMAVKLACF